MKKYFKTVKSFEDLKGQFKTLLKANHPDNGGDAEIMKEINVEFDSLFKIWRDKHNAEAPADQQTTETADSTRSKFYTDFGWEGSNHDWSRSLKEIAVIVRNYVKEKYPTFKFSVRTSYASMCQELHVSLKEAPFEIYKTFDELSEEEVNNLMCKAINNFYTELRSWSPEEAKTEIERIWSEGNHSLMMVYRDNVAAMLEDVDDFVKSYNYSDCDGMQDYFHVDFYYFDCKPDDLKIVPKTTRIKNKSTAPAKKDTCKYSVGTCNKTIPCCGCAEYDTCTKEKVNTGEPTQIAQKNGYTYKITVGEDTRDGSTLWIVRIEESLDRAAYIEENKSMKERGGYYSRLKHGFIFKFDPTDVLSGNAA